MAFSLVFVMCNLQVPRAPQDSPELMAPLARQASQVLYLLPTLSSVISTRTPPVCLVLELHQQRDARSYCDFEVPCRCHWIHWRHWGLRSDGRHRLDRCDMNLSSETSGAWSSAPNYADANDMRVQLCTAVPLAPGKGQVMQG